MSRKSKSDILAWIDAEIMRRKLAELPPVGEPLKNARHELYVRCYLSPGMTMKQAYLACAYSARPASVKGNASKIRHRPDVAKRILQIQTYRAERAIRGLGFY